MIHTAHKIFFGSVLAVIFSGYATVLTAQTPSPAAPLSAANTAQTGNTPVQTDAASAQKKSASALPADAYSQEAQQPPISPEVSSAETGLGELITEFEDTGSPFEYTPSAPQGYKLTDQFSPHVFTVSYAKEPEHEQKAAVSRTVTLAEKQRVEINYPGQGWVYIGEESSQPGLRYEQRKLYDNATIFTFTGEKKGSYILHFSYFDVFTDDFITDSLAVIVEAAKEGSGKTLVRAPDYKSAGTHDTANNTPQVQTPAAPHQEKRDGQSGREVPEPPSGTDAAAGILSADSKPVQEAKAANAASEKDTVVLDTDTLLEKARAAIDSADSAAAMRYLQAFFLKADSRLDEGLYLKGRAYELNGTERNIRTALEAYKALTDSFPQSKHWSAADSRIRYITAFYITIR